MDLLWRKLMKIGNSKAKGSNFERVIGAFLTLWASGQEKEKWFYRTPSSGAIATISGCNENMSGDIVACRPEGKFLTDKFSIEIKTGYESSSFHKNLKNVKNDEIFSFWNQSCGDASRSNKQPMLIYKKKGYNTLVGIPYLNDYNDLTGHLHSITLSFGGKLPDVKFFDMKEFFIAVKPEDI